MCGVWLQANVIPKRGWVLFGSYRFYSTSGADWRAFRVHTLLRDADRPPTVCYLRREVRFAPGDTVGVGLLLTGPF